MGCHCFKKGYVTAMLQLKKMKAALVNDLRGCHKINGCHVEIRYLTWGKNKKYRCFFYFSPREGFFFHVKAVKPVTARNGKGFTGKYCHIFVVFRNVTPVTPLKGDKV